MKFLSAVVLTFAASMAGAQNSADNFEMAKLGITMNGYDCDQVLTVVQTDSEDVLEITCKKSAGSSAEVVYIFTIDGAGFTITPK